MRDAWRKWKALKQRKRWVGWAQDAVLLGIALALVFAWQTRDLVASGEPLPAFSLRDLNGQQVTAASLQGKPTVLHLWAPWCGVCAADAGAFSSLAKGKAGEANVVSVALAYEDLEDVRRFVEKNEVDYPVLLGDDALMRALRVKAFPTTYFISPEGRIQSATVGYTTGLGLRLRLLLL